MGEEEKQNETLFYRFGQKWIQVIYFVIYFKWTKTGRFQRNVIRFANMKVSVENKLSLKRQKDFC